MQKRLHDPEGKGSVLLGCCHPSEHDCGERPRLCTAYLPMPISATSCTVLIQTSPLPSSPDHHHGTAFCPQPQLLILCQLRPNPLSMAEQPFRLGRSLPNTFRGFPPHLAQSRRPHSHEGPRSHANSTLPLPASPLLQPYALIRVPPKP